MQRVCLSLSLLVCQASSLSNLDHARRNRTTPISKLHFRFGYSRANLDISLVERTSAGDTGRFVFGADTRLVFFIDGSLVERVTLPFIRFSFPLSFCFLAVINVAPSTFQLPRYPRTRFVRFGSIRCATSWRPAVRSADRDLSFTTPMKTLFVFEPALCRVQQHATSIWHFSLFW